MLKKLRNKKTAKKVWIILAILIVPAFVLWGFGGALRNQNELSYAGKIFGKKISLSDYNDALEAVKNQAIIQFGDNFQEIQKYINLQSQAWDRIILLVEAKKRKINVSDKEVIESIESYPFFQRNAKFDNRIYSEILQYVFRAQPRIFEEQTRQNLILSKLYKQLTENIRLDPEEIKQDYRKLNEEISLYYIASIPADFGKGITVTEEEIKGYFSKNTLEFKQPLSFNIEYISLDSEDKIKSIASRLNKPRILKFFDKQARDKKEDFGNIIKDSGVGVKETGFFTQTDPIPGIGWSPEIINLISKLKIGQFSSPVQLDKSFYILRLKERREPYVPDFETIKDKAKEMLMKEKSAKIAKEKIGECFKKLQELYKQNPKQINFANIAGAFSLKSDSTSLFKFGSYIEGIGASDNFWDIARGLKEDAFSEVIDLGGAGFYIIKVKGRVPVDEKKFESEKNQFSERLLEQKKQEYFLRFVEQLKRKAQLF